MSTIPKQKSYSEKIKWNPTDGFYISRTFADKSEEEKLPLSTWNFVKSAEVVAILIRTIPNLDLDEGETRKVFYVLPIKYTISSEEDGETWYLREEVYKQFDSKFESFSYVRVYLKNLDSSQGSECPIPSVLYEKSTFPFLKIEKLKSHRLKKGELEPILKSGRCCGFFNVDMTQREFK
jgi:hypothetical protein